MTEQTLDWGRVIVLCTMFVSIAASVIAYFYFEYKATEKTYASLYKHNNSSRETEKSDPKMRDLSAIQNLSKSKNADDGKGQEGHSDCGGSTGKE